MESSLTFRTFGCHQNHTTGSTRTIDGSRSSIFQYGNGFNIFGINHIQVAFYVINQNQRLDGITIRTVTIFYTYRISTANLERLSLTGGISTAGNKQTGNSTLQRIGCLCQRTVSHHFIHLYRSNSTGQVGFFLRAITDNNYLIQCFGIFLKNNLNSFSITDSHYLRFITDISDLYLHRQL